MMLLIAQREWASAFRTPLAWVLLAACLVVLGWAFLERVDRHSGPEAAAGAEALNADLVQGLFGLTALLLLLIAPLLAARSLTDEHRHGTDELLGSAPVRLLSVVLGKLLGLAPPLLAIATLPAALCLSLLGAAPIDPGLLLAAWVGLALSALLFASAGLFTASLTPQPVAAALLAVALLVLLVLLGNAERLAAQGLALLDWLSWSRHLFWFLTGIVRTSDLGYFVLLSLVFVALTHRRLANQRTA